MRSLGRGFPHADLRSSARPLPPSPRTTQIVTGLRERIRRRSAAVPTASVAAVFAPAPATSQAEAKPRPLRFFVSAATTSSKPVAEIVAEVVRASELIGLGCTRVSPFLFHLSAKAPPCTVEIEICSLLRLDDVHGLRLKRLFGLSEDYKKLSECILAAVRL